MEKVKDYYVVLTGAKKNIGDFLITQKATELLNIFRPDRELIPYRAWENLDSHIDILNNSKAILILGGPGDINQKCILMFISLYRLSMI